MLWPSALGFGEGLDGPIGWTRTVFSPSNTNGESKPGAVSQRWTRGRAGERAGGAETRSKAPSHTAPPGKARPQARVVAAMGRSKQKVPTRNASTASASGAGGAGGAGTGAGDASSQHGKKRIAPTAEAERDEGLGQREEEEEEKVGVLQALEHMLKRSAGAAQGKVPPEQKRIPPDGPERERMKEDLRRFLESWKARKRARNAKRAKRIGPPVAKGAAIQKDGIWFSCRGLQGRRDYMEDTFQTDIGDGDSGVSVFGVFDGHGGSFCSEFCEHYMLKLIREHPKLAEAPHEALVDSFRSFDSVFCEMSDALGLDDGSTATVAVVSRDEIVVGHVGDSRSVLVRQSGATEALTRDHSGELVDERERIERMGGFVGKMGDVYRVQGCLAVTRALGDAVLKPYVSSEPEVARVKLSPNDKDPVAFLCIASDGVWDEVHNPEVGRILRNKGIRDGVRNIIDIAYIRGSEDNLTCMAIEIGSTPVLQRAPAASSSSGPLPTLPAKAAAPAVLKQAEARKDKPKPVLRRSSRRAKPIARGGGSGAARVELTTVLARVVAIPEPLVLAQLFLASLGGGSLVHGNKVLAIAINELGAVAVVLAQSVRTFPLVHVVKDGVAGAARGLAVAVGHLLLVRDVLPEALVVLLLGARRCPVSMALRGRASARRAAPQRVVVLAPRARVVQRRVGLLDAQEGLLVAALVGVMHLGPCLLSLRGMVSSCCTALHCADLKRLVVGWWRPRGRVKGSAGGAMEAFIEATNAGVGSACSKLVVYPFDLIKTRMAVSGRSLAETVQELQEEGGGTQGLYRGIGPKLVKSVTGKFFYFYLYSSMSKLRLAAMADPSQGLDTASNLAIGFLSEVLELPLIMPLEAVVSRVQANTRAGVGAVQIAREMFAEGGLAQFYVSLDAYVLGAMQPAIQMSLFDQLRPLLLRKRAAGADLSALEAFCLGTFASSLAVTATYPMDMCRTLSQTGRSSGRSSGSSNSNGDAAGGKGGCDQGGEERASGNLFRTMRQIVAREGAQGLFKGLSAQLFQSVLSAAIMLMVKEKIKAATTRLLVAIFTALGLLGRKRTTLKQAT
ncbi:Probable protein phosphatase 2C 59 (AtPP2C59) (HopW1-1-interacting protein 2) (Protein phosphatase 2C WIN2) (PP2C WIN2) [Durusdinium trenchii]|uniref:Probable protein phosphatase 2C 59 (AtPP2C59) (HopW1-1-interacting protein 2) (Protein phosphatase 2C WIN2) (PP2C WIN2) n=1 Tax=Durusdinium trenchii TaxID=1381693 RepID=A0ABP0RAT0_9DINO